MTDRINRIDRIKLIAFGENGSRKGRKGRKDVGRDYQIAPKKIINNLMFFNCGKQRKFL